MPLDKIRKKILDESDAAVLAIDKEASEEAHKITSEARSQAKEIEKQSETETESETKRIQRESAAGLEIESNAILLEAKGAATENAVKDVSKEMARIIEEEYLPSMLKSGLKQFAASTSEKPIIKTSRKYSKIVQQMKLSAEYGDIDGFVIESNDGKVRLTISPDSILENNMEDIKSEVLAELFSGRGEHIPKKEAKKVTVQIKAKTKAKKAKKRH